MRMFMAADVPREILEELTVVRRVLERAGEAGGADVAWIEPEKFHVTVKFLADVPDDAVPRLIERVAQAAGKAPAFEVEVEGIGRFPAKGSPRVIVSRILSPDQRMTRLHRLIDSAVGGMGLPMDTRVLVPHLTLGRVRSNRGINRLLRVMEKHDLDFFGKFWVDRIRVYQSVPKEGGGTRYTRLADALLKPVAESIPETTAVKKKPPMNADKRG